MEFFHDKIAPKHKDIALCEERLFADIGVGYGVSGKPDVVHDKKMTDLKTAGKRWAKGKEHTLIQPVMYDILLEANGYEINGDSWEEYVDDPTTVAAEEVRTFIYFPIK